MIPTIFYTNFIICRIAKQHLNLIIILIKNHIPFFVFVFSKVLSICELLLACIKKRIFSLTIAIYSSVMQHLAPL